MYLNKPTSLTCTSINQLIYRAFVNTHLLVHKHVKISVDEWILETTRPQKHVKVLEKVQRGTALSVINAIKWSSERVMEFNTFLSKLVTIKTLQRFSNTDGPFLKKLPNLRHPVPLQQVQQPDRLIH